MRYLAYLSARSRSAGRTGDKCVLVGVAAGHTPLPCYVAVGADLKTIRPLTSGLHAASGVVRIGRTRGGAVQPVYSGRHRQLARRIPFHAGLVVAELLRLYLLRDRGE